jgi:hypothetical protein
MPHLEVMCQTEPELSTFRPSILDNVFVPILRPQASEEHWLF